MKKTIVSAVFGLSLLAAGTASAQTYSSCVSLSSTLSVGSRGSQVLALQQFLVSQNYPGGGTWMETGYYGTATAAAVRDFQESRGLPQTGVVDSATLSALQNCNSNSYTYPGYPGTTYPYTTSPYTTYPYNYNYGYGTPTITSLSQNTGSPGQTVTIYGQGFEPTNTVYFGGEAVSASGNGSTQLTFTIPYISVYSTNQTVELYVTNSDGTSNSISFTLNPSVCSGYSTNCGTCSTTYPYTTGYNNCTCGGYTTGSCGCTTTYPYTSNCGTCTNEYSSYPYTDGCQGNVSSPTITYLSPNSGGIGTDVTVYGSGFTTSDNTVHFGTGIITGLGSPDGQSVSFVIPSELTGYGSQPVVLGNYSVSVTNSNNITTNAVSFDVTSTSGNGNGSGAPVISSVSGPTNVQTGVQNTWTLSLTDLNDSYTTVSVNWGDSNEYNSTSQPTSQTLYNGNSTVTFTHTYEESGTYTLSFTASNQDGQSNAYTETINVSGNGSQSVSYTATPTSGDAPLNVQFEATAPYGTAQNAYSVSFGDGTSGTLAVAPVCSGCSEIATVNHTYEAGTFNAEFLNSSGNVLSTASITAYGNGSNGTPTVSYLSPTSGYVGTQVTIYGSNFSTTGNNVVYFGTGAIENVYSNGSSLTFTVPSYVSPYCAPGTECPQYEQEITPGTYNVSVMDQYGTSNEISFTVL